MTKSIFPYYTIAAPLLFNDNTAIAGQVKLNIVLEKENDLTPQLFEAVSLLDKDYMLSLSSSLLSNTSADVKSKIYLLLIMNPSFKRDIIIPVLGENYNSAIELAINEIKIYLKQQGLAGIEFPFFNTSLNQDQTVGKCYIITVPPLNNFLQNEAFSQAHTFIILSLTAIASMDAFSTWRKDFNFETISNLAYGIHSDYILKEEFDSERSLWKKRVAVYQEFLSLSKKVQEAEYYEVLNWYKREYEILPLWYKQFGHIIKVIMGKRSFRSLFDDTVKKYKD